MVAIEPQTGRVNVMAAVPGFDPNRIPDDFAQLNRAPGSPLFNRSAQSGYPPGSTFKVVTAAAALDTGRFNPQSVLNGDSPKEIGGVPLANFGNQSFGPVTLTTALTKSINTVWARVGEILGKETMYAYMRRFGFNSKPPIDLPGDELRSSGVFDGGQVARRLRRRGHRPRGDRPGASARDAAPDGDGRVGGRKRRQADAATTRPGGARP